MNGSLAVFIGSTPNIGTSLTAFGTAYRIAAQTGKRIGYLCLNLKSAKTHLYLGVRQPVLTLDGMRPELRARTLNGRKLREYAYRPSKTGSLHVLFGNLAREQAEYYEAGDIQQLLTAAREAFELSILDVSSYWDNAATVCALQEADLRFMVTTNRLSCFQEDVHRWAGQMGSLIGLDPGHFQLVLLQTLSGLNGGYRMKEIHKETGCAELLELKLAESVHLQLDSGKLGEWLMQEERNQASFDVIATPLLSRLNWPERLSRSDRPWTRRLMLHRRRNS